MALPPDFKPESLKFVSIMRERIPETAKTRAKIVAKGGAKTRKTTPSPEKRVIPAEPPGEGSPGRVVDRRPADSRGTNSAATGPQLTAFLK